MGRYTEIERLDQETIVTLTRCTLPQVLAKQSEALRERVAIREKAYGIWQTYTWRDYFRYVRYTGLGLIALGLKRGDNIAIIMDNHPEWLFSEIGAQGVGAVTLNLFTSAVTEELSSALSRVQATFVVAQDQEQVDKLLDAKNDLSHVRYVIYTDPTGMRIYSENPWLISFRDLLDLGKELDNKSPELFNQELLKGNPDDVAVMIMTSGTTGISKIVMLTHRNFTEMARKWLETAPIGIGSNWMSISPPAWIVDQMWGGGVTLLGGMVMNFPETMETLFDDLREIGPSVIITASRFWEDLASKIRVKMGDAGFINRKVFAISERIGKAAFQSESQNSHIPLYLRCLSRLASMIIFRPLLDRVGCSKFLSAYTGGHPISPDVIRFFRIVGLSLKQCYGLTETGGIFQVQSDDEVKPETVGRPLPRTQIKISEDQEVLVSSETLFKGYYNDFTATQAAFDGGWFLTGDAGYLDKDGHLIIIGRKEEIIRDKDGNAFSPDFIETRLKFSLFIKEVVVFGEGRPFITAFINIDMGNVGNWAEERMIPYTTYTDLSQRPEVEELILGEVRAVNARLPDQMKIRKFILLYKLLDADDEELTRTGKVRRRFVYGLYISLIEAMYEAKVELEVKGKVRYRDGQVGMIETKIKIITVG
ncbi:MAG: AMP-binding protein [Thermodesulfobacteriota bacterium]|nr:AMP-binding protein [Thermodesulfobacteriota bacterium]